MKNPVTKPFSVFNKAKSESYSEKEYNTYNRVEKRMARMNQTRLAGKLISYRREGADMTPPFLNTVRTQLLHGNIQNEMKLQQEIDESEYANWLKKNRKL